MRSRITTADALNEPLPETIAAERLRQHLEDLAREVERSDLEPQPRSARQERLEHLVNGYF